MIETHVSNSFVLELTKYEECNENFLLPKESNIIHQLLLSELNTSPIPEVAMVDLTTTIELSKCHNLHVNKKLTPKQRE